MSAKDLANAEYTISSEEASVLKRLIPGIQSDEELKQHLVGIRSEAYAAQPYTCIKLFEFARVRIARHPAYKHALKLGQERKNAIFLELPCCVGSDSRMAIADGYPMQNVIASDIIAAYWPIGHKLFKTTPETYPVPFLQGDIFDPNLLKPDATAGIVDSPPPLKSLTSLTPLQHHVSVIYSSAFFHLFEIDKQRKLTHLFSSLLSPASGSIIFGYNAGLSDTEENRLGKAEMGPRGDPVFLHSPSSWRELWTGPGGPFTLDQVSLEVVAWQAAEVIKGLNPGRHFLTWSITRI